MLREVFRPRMFVVGLLFFVLIVVCGVFYLKHVEREAAEKLVRTNERIKQLTEKQPPTADEWHADPHTPEGSPPVEAPVAVPPKPEPHPYDALSAEEQEAYRQRSIAITLEYLPEKLALEEKNRDSIKRSYERVLRQLKYHEERNRQRDRNFFDTSRLTERIAELKAELDMYESVIKNLKKWRDEHEKK